MILILSALTGIIVGALPLNKFLFKFFQSKNAGHQDEQHNLPFSLKFLLVSADFIKGFFAANLPVFVFYGGFYSTVISIAAFLATMHYLPWAKKYNMHSIAPIAGALILFNPLLDLAYFAMWIILLIYKRRIIFADIFANTLIIILLVTYFDIFNKNSYPSASEDYHLLISFSIIFLIQLSSYYSDIKRLFLASNKSLRKPDNESN